MGFLDDTEKGIETKETLDKAYKLATGLKEEILKDRNLQGKVKCYLFQYAINKRASEIAREVKEVKLKGKEEEKQLQKELKKRYGEYVGIYKNDCYDFLMHIAGEAAIEVGVISDLKKVKKTDPETGRKYIVTFFSSDVRYGEKIGRGKGSAYPLKELKGKEKGALKPGSSFMIQPGCFVYVNYSPITEKKADHWAIYTDEGLLVNRGGIFLASSFEKFFSAIKEAPEGRREHHIYYLFGTQYKPIQEKVTVKKMVKEETGKKEWAYEVKPATEFDKILPLKNRE